MPHLFCSSKTTYKTCIDIVNLTMGFKLWAALKGILIKSIQEKHMNSFKTGNATSAKIESKPRMHPRQRVNTGCPIFLQQKTFVTLRVHVQPRQQALCLHWTCGFVVRFIPQVLKEWSADLDTYSTSVYSAPSDKSQMRMRMGGDMATMS